MDYQKKRSVLVSLIDLIGWRHIWIRACSWL